MFLMSPFSILDFMGDNALVGLAQGRGDNIRYWWPGILFLNLNRLPDKSAVNLDRGLVDNVGVDTGGQMCMYVRRFPETKIKEFGHTCGISSKEFFSQFFTDEIVQKYDPAMSFEVYANKFLHYGRGSNWDNSPQSYMRAKTNLIMEIVTRRLRGENIFKEKK